MTRRGERLLSPTLEASILCLVIMVAFQAASASDPFLCKAEARRLTDAELARASLVFLHSEQFDTPFLPRPLRDGYDISDLSALFEDSRFRFEVDREPENRHHGDLLGPRRSWIGRQVFGERLSITLMLPADAPGAPMLRVVHVSNPCGQVRRDLGHKPAARFPTPTPPETE